MVTIKKLFKAILEVIVYIAVFIGIAFVYYLIFAPDIIKDFREYDGIAFDYKLEESNYVNKLYYKQLNENEARHYRCMYHAAVNDKSKYYLSDMELFDPDEASRAVSAFGYDYPEYFWFSQVLNARTERVKDKLNIFGFPYVVVSADCFDFVDEDLLTHKKDIQNKINGILPLCIGENDYETVKNAYEYVARNVVYDMNTSNKQDLRAALLDGRGVCASYAEMFQLLCNKLGYECYAVQGDSNYIYTNEENITSDVYKQMSDDSSHEWVIIKINDNWYWIDPTWGDCGMELDDYYGTTEERVDYSYFLVPDDLFLLDHIPDDSFKYPSCSDNSYYLYDNSGIVVEEYDAKLINKCIIDAFKSGRRDFTFHFLKTEDVDSFVSWINNGSFYNAYEYNIYPYYRGNVEYCISTNCSVYLHWRFDNLY